MNNPTDYLAAAIAVANAPADSAAPAGEPAGAAPDQGALEAAEPAEAAESEPEEGEAEPEKPAAAPPKPDKITKSLADVAAAKAELRRERAALDAEAGPVKAVLQALKTRDAMALLAAANIPWSEAARQVLEGTGTKPPKKQAAESEDEDPRDARIAALEQENAANKANATKAKVLGAVSALVKDNEKFNHIAKLGEESRVLEYIERYHAQTGELPGETLEESLTIAAEAVEVQLKKEAARWQKVLQPASGAATLLPKAAVPAAEATSKQAKTLTNSTGSGPKTAPVTSKAPKSPEDYQRAALEALSAQ